MTQVECFGLHWEGPVGWLVQGRAGNNFVGLSKKCPFDTPSGMCNHLVATAAPIPDKIHWANFEKLLADPLVKIMLPIPRGVGDRCFYITDAHDDLSLYLTCLSRLSSPIVPVVKPAWMTRITDIERFMTSSNIQPWVVTQTTTKDQSFVNTVAKSSSYLPRTVVFTGKDEVVVPAPMKRIVTNIRDFNLEDLMTLPLESLGALILRRFARKESLTGPIEHRQERRDRLLKERTPRNDQGTS